MRSGAPSAASTTRSAGSARRAAKERRTLLAPGLPLGLELLVPPFEELGVVLGDVVEIGDEEARLLLRREVELLLQLGRQRRVGDGRHIAHLVGEADLGLRLERGVEIAQRAVAV